MTKSIGILKFKDLYQFDFKKLQCIIGYWLTKKRLPSFVLAVVVVELAVVVVVLAEQHVIVVLKSLCSSYLYNV